MAEGQGLDWNLRRHIHSYVAYEPSERGRGAKSRQVGLFHTYMVKSVDVLVLFTIMQYNLRALMWLLPKFLPTIITFLSLCWEIYE